ncbi:FAS1 domain-containing protein [Kalaharituber pfeilii]|nr:FAS1 domain-containing protein [Kalaharituber pfeilii]
MALPNFVFLVAITLLLLVSNVSALLSLDETLRRYGLDQWANFLAENPHPIYKLKDITVFAPTNDAVYAYQKDPRIVFLTGNSKKRDTLSKEIPINHFCYPIWCGGGKPMTLRVEGNAQTINPRGVLFYTGDMTSVGDPINAKVMRRKGQTQRYSYGEITSGGGVKAQILRKAIQFRNGWIYPIDRLFVFPSTFAATIEWLGYSYLDEIFERIPESLKSISSAKGATFFAPTPNAFWAWARPGFFNSTKEELQAFIDDHTIIGDFIGYTPKLRHEVTYRTQSGNRIIVRWQGNATFLNDSLIVGDNYITSNGVIQIINKVLT